MTRSLELRQDNFMHYEFIGNIYFSVGQYPQASKYLKNSSFAKPYFRCSRAKIAYCGLTAEIRDAKIFGDASNLDTIFEQDQNFYNDSPSWK